MALPDKQIQFILVNDGSAPQHITPKHINSLTNSIKHFKYIALPKNQGKGFAVRAGAAQSNAPIMLFTDVDFPYSLNNVLSLINLIETKQADIVTLKRNQQYYQHISKGRKQISQLLKTLLKLTMRLPVTDTQAGLKAFSPNGRNLILQTTINRYLFDIELLKMAKNKVVIKEVTAELKSNVELSNVSLSLLKNEFFNFLKILFK